MPWAGSLTTIYNVGFHNIMPYGSLVDNSYEPKAVIQAIYYQLNRPTLLRMVFCSFSFMN